MTGSISDLVVGALTRVPVGLATARAVGDGLPSDAGFYAWWTRRGALCGVPHIPHPIDADWGLLYVGVGPVRASSSQTLRSRVIGNHLSGNIGSSTFRLSLAALLLDQLDLEPRQQGQKVALTRDQNQLLSEWQREHLRITWALHKEPWQIEDQVIAALTPPLNLAKNTDHPFHTTMSDARRRLRTRARTRGGAL